MAETTLELRSFGIEFGGTVAGWVRSEAELRWLAPTTVPPLTAAKVVGWTKPTDRPLLMFENGEGVPAGYAELNPLQSQAGQLWLGHVVVDPARRGRGLGKQFSRRLLQAAFADGEVERVVLIVFPDNTAAVRCYRACGFEIACEERHRFRPGQAVCRMLRLEISREGYTRCYATP
jgi:RimJ/RimL family protein N-acetyltransferase